MKNVENLSVLQVIPTLNEGGAEQSCLDIGRALVASGSRASVLSSGGTMAQPIDAATTSAEELGYLIGGMRQESNE